MSKCIAGLSLMVVAVFFIFAPQAYGEEPLATLEGRVTAALDVLRNPALKGDAHEEAKEKQLWTIADSMFNYPELCKRTLGKQWAKLNPEQQKEFTDLFSKHLGGIYLDRIMTYTDEKVLFDKDRKKKNKAIVYTRIVTSSREIPIDYRMILTDGDWQVYDVLIEGVSLVNNYRSQFREMLKNKEPESLLKTLREKVKNKAKA